MQRFRVDLKTFLGLAIPNHCSHAVKNIYLAGLYVGFLSKKPPNLNDPYTIRGVFFMMTYFHESVAS